MAEARGVRHRHQIAQVRELGEGWCPQGEQCHKEGGCGGQDYESEELSPLCGNEDTGLASVRCSS